MLNLSVERNWTTRADCCVLGRPALELMRRFQVASSAALPLLGGLRLGAARPGEQGLGRSHGGGANVRHRAFAPRRLLCLCTLTRSARSERCADTLPVGTTVVCMLCSINSARTSACAQSSCTAAGEDVV